MMKVPPRLISIAKVLALLFMIATGVIKVRQILAMNDCLDRGHRWDHGRTACDDR